MRDSLFLKELRNAPSIVWISLAEVLNHPGLDEISCILGMTSNVFNKASTLLIIKHLAVEHSSLATRTKL